MTAQDQDRSVLHDNRVAFAEELETLAAADERIVAVTNDSVGSSNLNGFRDRFPDRLINVGIAEQNMVGVGAGLAAAGLIPFVCGATPFLTGRALEQVKVDVAYSQHPVILCGMSPGLAYGALGPTHHSLEDLSWLRALPGLDVIVPADRVQTRLALRKSAADPRPTFIRVGRYKVPDVTPEDATLERGHFDVLADGSDATIIATGTTVAPALAAADDLRGRVSVRVLNATYLAPIDEQAIAAAAAETSVVITAEEANTSGGLGAAVASVVAQLDLDKPPRMRILGPRSFAPTGDTGFLLDHFGLSKSALASVIEKVLEL